MPKTCYVNSNRRLNIPACLKLAILALLLSQALVYTAEKPDNIAGWYWSNHLNRMDIAKRLLKKNGKIDLVFLGDSITDFWNKEGKNVWNKNFAPYSALNLGQASDSTGQVLWRVQNGELEGFKAKLVVLMIGTNDRGPADKVFENIKKIIAEIQKQSPGTRVLLLGIFPGHKPDNKRRKRNEEVNKLLPTLTNAKDPKMVVYMDISSSFVDKNGEISKEIMHDLLHPTTKGYEIWASAINDTVKKLMQLK